MSHDACHIPQPPIIAQKMVAMIGVFSHISAHCQRDAAQACRVSKAGLFKLYENCKPDFAAQTPSPATHLFQSLDLDRQARDPIRGLPSFCKLHLLSVSVAKYRQWIAMIWRCHSEWGQVFGKNDSARAQMRAVLRTVAIAWKTSASGDGSATALAMTFRSFGAGATTTQMPQPGVSRRRLSVFRPLREHGPTRAQGTANV